jgi:hypothetical protein
MKHVQDTELVQAIPIVEHMTRAQKLQRLARLVRECPSLVHRYNGLEYAHPDILENVTVCGSRSALSLAGRDPEFQKQGLSEHSTIAAALRFFELTRQQAHAFSCDCHGRMTNEQQAHQIERLV